MPYTLAEQEKNRRIKAEENRRYYEALAKKQEEEEAKRKEQREKRRQEIDAIQNGEPITDTDAPEGSLFMGADKMWSNIANNPQAMRNRNDAFEDERISLVEEDKDFSKRLDRTTQKTQQLREKQEKQDEKQVKERRGTARSWGMPSSAELTLGDAEDIRKTEKIETLYLSKDNTPDTNKLKNDIYSRYIKNGKLDNLIDFKYYVRNGKINDDNIYLFTDNSNLTKDQKETFKKIFEKEKNIAKKQLRQKLVALKDRIEKSDDYSSLNKNANIHQINNALEILDAPDKSGNALTAVGNYFKGIGNHLTDSDLWSVGVTQLNRSRYTNNAAEQFDKNYKALKKQYKNLTDEEIGQRAFQNLSKKHQDALTTYYALMQAQDLREYDTSLGYQAGQTTADMIPFAISLAGGSALNGVLRALTKGIGSGLKATRAINIASKGGKVLSNIEEIEALTKGALRGAKSGFKNGLPKILGGKGATSEITEAGTTFKGVNYGKNLGKDLKNSLADALTATVISPNSWANLKKEKADKHIAHEDFTLKDYARVWSSNFVENATETMSSTLFRPFRTAYNMALDKAFHIKPSYLLNNKNFSNIYHNKMYIGGTVEELMEEYLGAGWNTMNGYILGDDELKKEWSNFMTKDSQAVLYASIVPSTMIMPVASGGLRMLHNHQNSKAYRKAKETLNDLFNNYGLNASNLTNVVEASISCGGFTDTGNNNYVQNVANALIGAVQTSYGQEEAKRVTAQVLDYIAKAHRLNGTLRSFSQDVMNMSAEERENLCKELADVQERVAYNNVIYNHIKHGRYLTIPDANGQEENYLAQAFTIDENGNLVQLGVVTDRFTNDKGEDAFRIRDAFGSEFDMTLNELNRAVEHTALENNPIVFTRVSDALDYLEGQTEQGSREANEIQTRRLLNNIGVSVNANGERVVVSATLKDADGNVSNAFVSNINEQSNSAIAYYIDEDGNIRSRQVSLDEIETIEEKTIEQAIDETNKIFTAYNMGVEQYQEQYQQARDLNQTLDNTLPPSHTEQTQQPTDQTTDEQETTDDEQETEQDNGVELQEGVDYNINALEYLQEGDLITITDFGGYEELRDVEGVEGKVAYTDENGVVVEYTENGVVVRQVAIKRDYNRITFTYNGHAENNVSVTNEQNVDEGATSATEDTNGNNNQVGETENNSVTAETETAQNEQQTDEPQQTTEQQETETAQEETAEQQTTEQQEPTQPVAEQTQEPTAEQQPTEQPKQEQEVAEQTQSKPTQQTEQEEVTEEKQTTETAQEGKTKEKEEQETENKDVAEKQIDNTKWKNSNKIDGRRSRKVLADNTELKGHYVIVEADSLTPSHSPFTFGQNENFPTNKDGKTMNSRDYQTKEEQGKVIRIAQNYGKQAVMDAPIVDNNGIVLSGNGRTMAGQLASRQHTDKEYLDYLKEISEEEFGISPEQYEDMKSPRVVFVLDNDMEYTTANFDKFNRKGEESQSTTARAVVVSKSVTEKQVKEIGEWLSNAIDNSPSNLKIETILKQNGQEVISLLVKVGILQPNETAQYIDTNERGQRVLNGNGVDFITGVLYGVCFNERGVQVCKSWQNSIGTTIIASINEIIANKNLSGGFSLIDDLQEALNVVAQCLQEKTTIDAYFGQTSMFGEDSLKTRTVKMLAELIMSKDIKELKNVLISYNKYALQTIENPNNLFGETIDKERVLTDIIKQYEREKQQRKHTGKQTSTSDSSQKSERVTQTNSNTDRGTSTADSDRRTTEQDKQGKGEEVKNHRTTTPTTQLTEEDKALTSALIDVMQHSNGKLEVITDEQWANEIIDREREREKQRGQVKEEINKKFNEQLDTLTEENADNVVLSLGMPSNILLSAGVENKSLKLYGNKIIKKAKKHGFKIKDLRDLPRAVANPIAVFKGNVDKSFAILTEMEINGNNVLVSLSIGKNSDIDFNIISSVYGKANNGVIEWIHSGRLLYIDKEKAFNYLRISTPIVEAQSNQRLIQTAKIIQNFENPQIKHEKNLQENIQFFKTSKGECYGFTVGGKIYIDTRIAKADTPIHEFTHLWARALRENNPNEWKNIVALMKKQTHLWEYVKNLYPELTDEDAIADEVLAHFSGKRGLERLEAEQKRLREDKSMNLFAKARALQAIKNVKQALERFWKDVADFLHIHFTTAEEVADKVLADLLNGVNPNEFIKDNEADRKATNAKGETIAEVNSDNVVEMNYETWTNKETGDKVALRKFFKRLGLDDNTIKEMIEYGDAVAEAMQRFMDEFPLFAQFQNKKASKRPFIKDMGEYITIDYSYNCIKKEALNSIIEVLIQEGKSGHLGETQIEAIKNILQKNDFLVSCAMCYVEAKRRILKQAKRDEMIWNNVCKAVGLKNDFIATYIDGKFVTNSVELTAEQEEFLNKLIKGDEEALNKVENYSEKSGEGIKKDSIIKVAKLILNNDTLRGNLNYEWFMTPKRFSAFYETFADTGITEYLSEGQYRGKQLLDAIPFSFYSLINNNSAMIEGKVGNSYSMLLKGGIRQFSYEDARAIMFFDYFTQFLLLQGMRLPLQMYTKRPFMPAMFGLSGAKINQSLVVDVWTGADWHRDKLGLSEKEYTQWLKDHAGFVPKGALSKDDKRYKQDSMELVPLWSDASFPVDIAIENSQNKAFDGNVGNTALAPSIEFIKWALDNEDIHQILPYHSGGASNTFKETKGYHLATDMNDGYLTKNKNGKKVDDIDDFSTGIRIKNGKLEFNRLLIECDNDARKATQVYLDFCKKNGLTPMFNYEGVVDHPNYYKLLTDFRVYQQDETTVAPQMPVKAMLPENWKDVLGKYLEEEENYNSKTSISLDDKVLDEIRAVTKYTSIEEKERETLIALFEGMYGKNNVQILNPTEFDKQFDNDTEQGKAQPLRDKGGMCYGYAVGTRLVLNSAVFNANTPMHEHAHIFMKVLKDSNPELYARGMELWKDTQTWKDVEGELSALGVLNNLDENTRNDRILSEIVARFSGNINEEVIARVTGVTDKNWIQKVVTWLKDIWQGVKSAFDKWLTKDLENLTAEQFAQMPVRAIYDEKERKSYTAKLKKYKEKNGVKETTNTTENSIEMHHNERTEKFSNLNKQAIALEKSVADELHTAQQNVVDRLIKNINIEVVSLSGEELLKEAMKYSSQIDEVLKTQDGNIYGFTVGGKIFLNKEIADTNTKMHELTHLWDASCRKNNPTLWKRGVELMKQTALWKEIKESGLYDNLTDDELASEVHARLTGEEAEQIFGQMNETARENGSNAQILNRLSIIQKLKNWIKDFWYWVKDTQIDWRDKDANKVSLKDFINMPIVDLVKGTELDGDFSTIQFKIDPKGRVQTPKEMMRIAYNLQMGYHWDKNKHEWVQNKNSLLTWIDRIFDRFSAVRRMVTIAKLDGREIKANPYYELIQADNVISGKEEVFAMEHAMRINAVIDKIIKATGWSRDEVMHLLIAKAMPGRTAKMIADKYKELKNKTLTILGAVSISGDDLTFVQQFDILLSGITTDDVDNKLSELGIDIDKIFVGKSDKVQRQKADFIQSVRLLIAGEKYRDTYSYDTTSINTTDGYRGENDTEGQVQGWNGEHDLYKSPLYKRFFGEDERSLHTPQEIMEKAKAEIGDELYNALTDEIKSAVDEVKKSAFIYNLVTKKTLQRFLLSDKYWLPLRGWDENLYSVFGEDTARQRILEKAKGRNTIADNPLQYLYSMYSTTIRQGVYNNAKKTLIDFLFKHGDLLIENGKTASAKKYKWKPKNREEYKDLIDESKKYLPDDEQDEGYVITSVPPDIDEVALDSNGQVNIIAGILSNDELDEKNLLFFDTLNIFDGTYDRAYTKGIKGLNKYIFTYKDERGIEYKVAINDKKLVKILNTPNLSSPLFSKGSYLIFARITRLMSSLMTSKNLGFMIRNLERDYQTAMFTEVPGMDNYRKHYNKHIHEDLKMLAKIILTPNETQRKLQEKQLTAEQRYTYEMYKQWLESGGATGMVYNFGTVARALESYAKTARGDIFFNLVKMPNEKTDKVMGVLKNIASLKYLELLSEVGENLIRFASYRAFLDEGMNEKEAAYQSRESTVNFTRWGVGGKFLNGFYPFFSATINALYRNGRLIVHNPKGFALQTAIYIGVGLMQGMFMAMIGSGDGDGDDKKNSILRYILGAISGGVVGGAVGGLLGGKKGMYIGAISSATAGAIRGAMGNNSPYENVSDYLKLRNFYLPISNLSNVYVSVPQEQVPSYALGLLTTQVALGLKTPIKATYEMMQTLVALFPESGANIVNGFMEYNGAEDKIKGTSVKERREIAYSLLPNAIQVFTDLDRNKNFMGYNIILPDSKNEDYHKTRASRTRGEYRTYGWSRALATAYNKLMNSSLRGVSKDEYQRLIESKNGTIISGEKLITVAPEDMQYIFSGLLPMYSNILTSTEDFVKSRKAVSLSNLPIISNAIASRESKERDFWQANAVGEQLEERYKSVKKNINSYSEKDLQQLQKDEYYKMFVAYDNQRANVLKERKKIKEQIDKIQKSKVLPRRQREELIEKKYDKINHLWDNWIKEYHIKSLEYITKK